MHLNLDGVKSNVTSVSEVRLRGIWAECRRLGARYALLGDEAQYNVTYLPKAIEFDDIWVRSQ